MPLHRNRHLMDVMNHGARPREFGGDGAACALAPMLPAWRRADV
jgi:hypothetical protein